MQTRLVPQRCLTEAERILNEFADENWLGCDYFINPYVGREVHRACWYAQSTLLFGEREPSFDDFRVHTNANTLLNKELAGVKVGGVCLGEDINEPYPAVEQQEMLVRKCLDVLRLHRFPVHIVTGSEGVLRDVDMLKEITETAGCRVTVMIPTHEHKLATAIDPDGPAPAERFELVRRLREEGIIAGAGMIPLIPYVLRPKGVWEIFRKAREVDASYVIDRPLTLLEVRRNEFLTALSHSPQLKRFAQRLTKMYAKRTAPYGKAIQQLNRACFDASMEFDLSRRIPAWSGGKEGE